MAIFFLYSVVSIWVILRVHLNPRDGVALPPAALDFTSGSQM